MKKYYTDKERYEWSRKCKISGESINKYAEKNGIPRATLMDWMNA